MSVYLQFDSLARSSPYLVNNEIIAAANGGRVFTNVIAVTTHQLDAEYASTTITSNFNEELIIDDLALEVGDRVLVICGTVNEPGSAVTPPPGTQTVTSSIANGIYTVTNTGSNTTDWVLTRTTDLPVGATLDPISFVQVDQGGDLYGSKCLYSPEPLSPVVDADPITFIIGCGWVPNDNYDPTAANPYAITEFSYAKGQQQQAPANYRVFYRELNDCNNVRTIGFLQHCKERPVNLNYSVELCTVIIPACALVAHPVFPPDGGAPTFDYRSVLDEPYLYVRMMPINHAEGKLIYTNNQAGDDATFMIWNDKYQLAVDVNDSPPPDARDCAANTPSATTRIQWVIFKSCMNQVMRLDLCAQEWEIRIYDRFGNNLLVFEDDNGGEGIISEVEPAINPNIQTSILVGIRPNYPL